jgi:hypothetical protein
MAAGGFDWCGVKVKLELHGLWRIDIERGLSVCEAAMLNAEAKARERESAPRKAAGRKR